MKHEQEQGEKEVLKVGMKFVLCALCDKVTCDQEKGLAAVDPFDYGIDTSS